MKLNIILEDFTAEFSNLLDKDRFECIETKEAGTWIVRKRETVLGTEYMKITDGSELQPIYTGGSN